jgi:hypothetical protein
MAQTRRSGWSRPLVAGGLAGALAAALWAWAPARTEGEALPADVAALPADAVILASVRAADLWESDLTKPARDKLARELGDVAGQTEKLLGARPADIERLSFLVLSPGPGSELTVVGLKQPYDKAKVKALAGPDAKEETFKGHTLFAGKQTTVALIGDRAYVRGAADPIRSFLDRTGREKEGPLSEAKRLLAGKHSAVAALNVPLFAEEVGGNLPGEAEGLKPLLEAKSATISVDLAEESRGTLRLKFAGEAEARRGVKGLQAGVELARTGLALGKKELARVPGGDVLGKLLDQLDLALKDAKVEQDGALVRATARMKIDAAVVTAGLADAVRKQQKAAGRMQSVNNLKQIALAMHNWVDANGGTMPPEAVFGKDGKPLLSWRVLILPYVEQDDLYKQFHLNEPWDSEHNKKLLGKMPSVYAAPGQKSATDTHYQGFYGKGAFFEGKQGRRFPADFPDGTSNTIMVVEAAKGVPWTKPEDLDYDPAKPLPKLGGLFPGGFNAALCDGSVRFISNAVTPKTLHLLIQRNDGQPLPGDF